MTEVPPILRVTLNDRFDPDELQRFIARLADRPHVILVQGKFDEESLYAFRHAAEDAHSTDVFPASLVIAIGDGDMEWVHRDQLLIEDGDGNVLVAPGG